MNSVYGAVEHPRHWSDILGWCIGSAAMLAQGYAMDGYEATVLIVRLRMHLKDLEPADRLAVLDLLTEEFCVRCDE